LSTRYRRSTYAIAKQVVKVAHVAYGHLIAAKRIVPELIQMTSRRQISSNRWNHCYRTALPRQSMMQELAQIRVY